MLNRLARELDSGLPAFEGTFITARIPVTQAVLNEAVAAVTNVATFELNASNVITARVFGISINATILRTEPQLKIVLGFSFLVRVGLRTLAGRLPFLTVQGSEAILDLQPLLAAKLPRYDHLLSYVRLVQIRTEPGLLHATLEFSI